MFAGGIIALENSKIGGYILATGAICLIVQGSEGTKDKCGCNSKSVAEESQKTDLETDGKVTACRVEGSQVLFLDKSGNVVEVMPKAGIKKVIGSNKK